jgi:Lon protease-like protein
VRFLLAAAFLGWCSLASAEEPVKLTLSLTVEEAMLMVQTLSQLRCQSVSELAVCQKALDLIHSIREQATKQVK